MDVSKADDKRLSNNPKIVNIVEFTEGIVQGLAPKATEKGLRILFKPHPEGDKEGERRLSPVYYSNVDNDHLREILSNLVENAIKYTPKGEVVIDVTGDTDHVIISVADSGIGIPKEDQTHLFQKFYRVDNSDTREIGGTGLGLYLSRRLTETMGGRIWVESEYKKGSTFYLEIPRTSHEEATRLIESAALQQETPIINVKSYITPDASSAAATAGQTVNTIVEPTPVAPAPVQAMPAQPQPVAPTPQPMQQPQVAPAPTYAPPAVPVTPQPPNIPLTSIEQNPSQYLRGRADGVAVPPRNQN